MRCRSAAAVAALGLTVALLASGCAAGGDRSGGSASDPLTLVRDRCTRCHNAERIQRAQHDVTGWTTTLTRMRTHGVQLSDAELQAVATFLAGGGASSL